MISIPVSVGKNDRWYNMEHPKRGRAIIFNHMDFKPIEERGKQTTLTRRAGTDVDGQNLHSTLSGLGFQVSIYKDPSLKNIEDILDEAAGEDHSDADCFLVSVMSHGGQGVIYANDQHYPPERLWSNFTSIKCPSLAGKPKIFLVQACRGSKTEEGVTVIKTEGAGPNNEDDFLLSKKNKEIFSKESSY